MAKISDRLLEIYLNVKPGSKVADIGTDHAILPISLVENNVVDKAIATDVAKNPAKIAMDAIEDADLSKEIEVRVGSGFDPIHPADEIDTFIIAGMGGELISQIIASADKKLFKRNSELILQPNNEEQVVRETLIDNEFEIIFENIIFEKGHYYQIIVAKKESEIKKHSKLELELEFGPYLLSNKNDFFIQKWEKELKILNDILKKLDKKNNEQLKRMVEIENKIKQIKEALND